MWSGCWATAVVGAAGDVGAARSAGADLHDGIVSAARERSATLLEVVMVPMAKAPKHFVVVTVDETPWILKLLPVRKYRSLTPWATAG